MSNVQRKPFKKFRISDNDLNGDVAVQQAYVEYSDARLHFGDALRKFNEKTKFLHDKLDPALRSQGLVPPDKDWSPGEDEDDSLTINVWDERRRRGRKKPSIELQQLKLGSGKRG